MRTCFLQSIRAFVFALCLPSLLPAYEVLALSGINADYTVFVTDDYLKEVTGNKGGSEMVSYELFQRILEHTTQGNVNPQYTLGASGLNTILGLQSLGHSCGLLGKLGGDDKGKRVLKELGEKGLTLMLQPTSHPTAQCICLITPEGERTMRTFLGPTHDFSDLPLSPASFEGVHLMHAEGYLMYDPSVIARLFKLVKEADVKVSLDMGAIEVVRARKELIWDWLQEGVDIVFANADEARELTSLPPSEACETLASFCDIAVVTMGKEGGWVQRGQEKIRFSAYPAQVLDTTGAGDLFISGFLHGILSDYSLEKSAYIGSCVAAKVVENIGAELSQEQWAQIAELIDEI